MMDRPSRRKRTMAEEEEDDRRAKEAKGCRRSARKSHRIVTSPYRRLHQLFWQDTTSPSSSILGRFKYKKVHDSPHVYVIDDFLTASELKFCDALVEKSKFSKSFVDNAQYKSDEEQRTSRFVSLQKLQNAPIASIERRAAELLGLSVEQMEPLQLVRYNTGEFFGLHHDLGTLYQDGSVELPVKQCYAKRRMVTIFCYLNEVEQGGCTHFPLLGNLRVTPKRGRAVVFCNITQNGMPEPQTVHEGEPPTSGIKYGLNIWACEE